jgi:hypothetical protein
VPADWQHPKHPNGKYVPLFEQTTPLEGKIAKWNEENELWKAGRHPDQLKKRLESNKYAPSKYPNFEDWDGGPPNPDDYMPYWPESERTHYQMYETVTEGTPISPVLDSPEILARWLADNNANAYAGHCATYEEWLAMCRRGWAPTSVLYKNGDIVGGVAYVAKVSE